MQAICIAVFAVLLVFIPDIYFSSTHHLVNNQHGAKDNSSQINATRKITDQTIYLDDLTDGDMKPSIFRNLGTILRNKVFLFSALALANLFFIITVVQYWAPDYLQLILHYDEDEVNIAFIIICITSPTLGVIFGGFLSSHLGGYESKHSLTMCMVLGLGAALFTIPVPFVDSLYIFTGLLWVVLFFGGAILPTITGKLLLI